MGPTKRSLMLGVVMDARPILHLVICTYNRAASLDGALTAIALQAAPDDGRWATLVVDNNCSDETQDVIAKHRAAGRIPGLTTVPEPRQGLTEARQRGFLATEAPWIGFVDDDCFLHPGWVEGALEFIESQPDAAAFNGRNVLDYAAGDRPWLHPEMFAGLNLDVAEPTVRQGLHGAGLVLRRDAVERSGWLAKPSAPDRRGSSLISGGDNELSIRARAGAGDGDLWFVPAISLTHRVDAGRTSYSYLLRLNYRLAESFPLTSAMVWEGGPAGWFTRTLLAAMVRFAKLVGLPRSVIAPDPLLRPGAGLRGRLLSISRAIGFLAGLCKVLAAGSERRNEILGLATSDRVAAQA